MENLRAIEAGPATLAIIMVSNEEEVMDGIRKGRFKAGLIIPAEFSKRVVTKNSPEIGLFLDNTDGISAETIRGAGTGAQASMNLDYVFIRKKKNTLTNFFMNIKKVSNTREFLKVVKSSSDKTILLLASRENHVLYFAITP